MDRRIVGTIATAASLACLFAVNLQITLIRGQYQSAEIGRNAIVEQYVPDTATDVPSMSAATIAASKSSDSADPTPSTASGTGRLPAGFTVKVPVLMYHYVRPITPKLSISQAIMSVTPENFRKQMTELVDSGYHAITPDDLYFAMASGTKLPDKPVLITFDDGYRGQYEYAYPILAQLGLKATFFVITDYTHGKDGYLTREMLQEMDRSGLMTLASHTRHHAGLTDYKLPTQLDEIVGSKDELQKILGHDVTSFAYPYGKFNPAIVKLVRDAGYRLAFSTRLGSVHALSAEYDVSRIRVKDGTDVGKLLGNYSR